MTTEDTMRKLTAMNKASVGQPTLGQAPILAGGIYVNPDGFNRYHVAAGVDSRRTRCGRWLEDPAGESALEPEAVWLIDVCRRCAGYHLELMDSLGLAAKPVDRSSLPG